MQLKVFNTLTREKEVFKPVQKDRVNFYVCGPTVYDYVHLGNARVFIVFDVIRRYLENCGYQVIYVQNFTDIDDKMIKRAEELGLTVDELAQRYMEAYNQDARQLRVKEATYHPRATEHIQEIIKIIETLVEKGVAYQSNGDVIFDTAKACRYGVLSQQNREDLIAGARVEVDEKKRHPLDFVLWKSEKPGEPSWESPWGRGRPGWHIECSAMAMTYLGETIDMHAGGPDLVFPHHENEIAQSEGTTGKTFVRYWLHTGYLNINEEKMSKSLGNVWTVRGLVNQFHPLDIRFFILSSHYRSPLNFDQEQMQNSINGRKRLQNLIEHLQAALPRAKEKEEGESEHRLKEALKQTRENFRASMHDDFNTAEALGELFNLSREVNHYLQQPELHRETLEEVWDYYKSCNDILEVLEISEETPEEEPLEEKIWQAIQERERARKIKDFSTADRIRDELRSQGIILEDTPHGVRWKRK